MSFTAGQCCLQGQSLWQYPDLCLDCQIRIIHSTKIFQSEKVIAASESPMVMRIKRTIDIAMSNFEEIVGFSVFDYEARVAYASDNMDIQHDISALLQAWNQGQTSITVKHFPMIIAQATKSDLVAISTDGAISLVIGTGKGIWFVAVFVPMDANKESILKECIQAAKNLESSVSVFDV